MSTENRIPQENRMGTMPVNRLMLSMAWPAILSMLIQACYNIVDTYFVSSIPGAVAAITYIFPINMLMISFAVGTGVGINSLIARRLGARRFDDANSAAAHGYLLAVGNWLLFAIFGTFFAKIFMHAYSEDASIIDQGIVYLRITTICCLFIMIQITNEKILQSTGNMILPMLCSLTGAITNIIMDPILIFGLGPFPEMGIKGAAVATVTSQLFSMILGCYLMFSKDHHVKITFKGFHFSTRTIKDIYQVGAPAIVMQAIGSVMGLGLNSILGAFSDAAVEILGIYQRIQSFVFMPCFGLCQGALPVMGYNYGARNRKRFMDAYKCSLKIAFTIMGAGFIIFQLFSAQILGFFHVSDAQLDMGVDAFRIISICFIPAAYGIMTSNVFQATGHGMLSLWSSLIRQLIGILPAAFILSRFVGVTGVWMAFPLAEVLGITYLVIAFIWLKKKELNHL